MCFRGLLLGCLLARGWSPWTAVLVTAVAFASIHGQYFLPGLTAVFVSGCLFGWLRVISGGLAAPILAHGLMNGWVLVDEWAALGAA
jgi:membrane protease YdiL (CAAX protease family)